MYSLLTDSSSDRRRPRWTSVATSLFVHAVVMGSLLVIGGPVWRATRPRLVTHLAAPVRVSPRPVVRRVVGRIPSAEGPSNAAAVTQVTSVGSRALELPTRRTRAELQIETPAEIVVTVTMPVASMPQLVVRPAVQVGLLESVSSEQATKRAVSTTGGFDSGATQGRGRATRTVASVGFDGATGVSPQSRRTVRSGSFDEVEKAGVTRSVARVAATPFEGIEILEKPQPVYSDEARRLRIEGTVQLRVVFGALGRIRVVSVVKGLGHGLDEAAVQAAEAIRFRPARRDGRPVDAPAVIQIEFQIA